MANGDSRNSAIKQVASGRFGVTSEYLVNAREIQIKMAQGAKPGEGGQLPGSKVYPWVAKTRHSTPGVGLISPPPHHDVYSIEDLAQLIHDLKNGNRARAHQREAGRRGGRLGTRSPRASPRRMPTWCSSAGTMAAPAPRRRPRCAMRACPGSWGSPRPIRRCLLNNLRSRIAVEVDGQLKTGRDVLIAALLGAERVRFRHRTAGGYGLHPDARLPSQHLPGRHRHPGSAPCARSSPASPSTWSTSCCFVAQELRELMAELGFRKLEEVVGRGRPAGGDARRRALEGEGPGLLQHPVRAGYRPGHGPLPADGAGPRPSTSRWTTPRSHAAVQARHRAGASRWTESFRSATWHRVVGTMTSAEITPQAQALPACPKTR